MRFCLIIIALTISIPVYTRAESFKDLEIDWNTVITQGNFGNVYKAKSLETGKEYVVKLFTYRKIPTTVPKLEVRVLYRLTAKKIDGITELRFKETIDQKLYLVFDSYTGDLGKFIHWDSQARKQSYSEFIALRLIRTLKNINENDYANYDIKPTNILLDKNGTPHIANFGLVDWVRKNRVTPGARGDMAYASPEMMTGKGFTYKSDVWSLGITLIELFTGRHPFRKITDREELRKKIKQFSFSPSTKLPNLSKNAKIDWAEIISYYMIQPESRRMTAHDLYERIDYKLKYKGVSWLDVTPEKEDYKPIGFLHKSNAHPLSERFCIGLKRGVLDDC